MKLRSADSRSAEILSAVLAITLLIASNAPAYAEKKWVFIPGHRQAVLMDTDQMPAAAPRQTTQPVATQATAQPIAHRATDYKDTVLCGGMQRDFTVHVPPSYDRSRPTPVVLVFHGQGVGINTMIAATGYNGVSNSNGFIVVYCHGVKGQWEYGMGRLDRGIDDVAYVNAVLTRLSQTLNVDSQRVYASGLSNGGYFVQILALSMPDKIAAACVVGSTAMTGGLTRGGSSKPIPIVFFLGTEDPLINFSDGRAKSLGKFGDKLGIDAIGPEAYALTKYGGWMDVPDTINFWTAYNGCGGSARMQNMPDVDPHDGMRVSRESYGSGRNEVVLYKIEGGTHSWPGTPNFPGVEAKSCQDIDASQISWQFFRTHSR